jgi:hypothetical protein
LVEAMRQGLKESWFLTLSHSPSPWRKFITLSIYTFL